MILADSIKFPLIIKCILIVYSGLPLTRPQTNLLSFTSSHRFVRRSTLQVEQKRIFLNLRENGRGRYLRIVEVPTKGIVLYGKLVSN